MSRTEVFVVIILSFLSLFLTVEAQYETPDGICGGWLKSTNGSMVYNSTMEYVENEQDKVCIWTINPDLPAQNLGFKIHIETHADLDCPPGTKVAINHFNLSSKVVTARETWTCGAPQTWDSVPGTVMFVVFIAPTLTKNTGFALQWTEVGDRTYRIGIRTQYYSWGKTSVSPYLAANTFSNEIATYAFSKGNNTRGYQLQMHFESIRFSKCRPVDEPCKENILLVCVVRADGTLAVEQTYTGDAYQTSFVNSEWGIVLIAWPVDYLGGGASFQLVYNTVRT